MSCQKLATKINEQNVGEEDKTYRETWQLGEGKEIGENIFYKVATCKRKKKTYTNFSDTKVTKFLPNSFGLWLRFSLSNFRYLFVDKRQLKQPQRKQRQ